MKNAKAADGSRWIPNGTRNSPDPNDSTVLENTIFLPHELARLLKQVFDIEVEYCPHFDGNLKIIAAIEEPRGSRQDYCPSPLAHLGGASITTTVFRAP